MSNNILTIDSILGKNSVFFVDAITRYNDANGFVR